MVSKKKKKKYFFHRNGRKHEVVKFFVTQKGSHKLSASCLRQTEIIQFLKKKLRIDQFLNAMSPYVLYVVSVCDFNVHPQNWLLMAKVTVTLTFGHLNHKTSAQSRQLILQ